MNQKAHYRNRIITWLLICPVKNRQHSNENVKDKACEVFNCQEFTFVNDCNKNEHNRAKTQWVFEPVSVIAGVFLQRLGMNPFGLCFIN